MPLLNFKAQFADPIRKGIKAHTIRAKRKIPVKPGDILYLYCGLRHSGAYRILPEPVKCTKVEPISINVGVMIDGHMLDDDECESLALADGFDNFYAMMDFWNGRLPFEGNIIHWKPEVRDVG